MVGEGEGGREGGLENEGDEEDMVCVAVGGRCCHCGKEEVEEVNIHICTHTCIYRAYGLVHSQAQAQYEHTHTHPETPPTYPTTTNLLKCVKKRAEGQKE